MADDFLPPVVGVLAADISAYLAGLTEAQARMDAFVASQMAAMAELDARMAGMGAAGAAGGDVGAAGGAAAAATAAQETAAANSEITASTDAMTASVRADYDAIMVKTEELRVAMTQQEIAAVGANTKFASAMDGTAAKASSTGAQVQKGLGMVGLAGVAAAAATVEMAGTFDQKMELIATQAHVPQAEVDALKEKVLALAPAVGIGPDKLAEGLYHVASVMESMGGTPVQMMDALTASAKGSATGLADLDTVTYAMSGVLSSAMPDVKNAQDGMNLLNTIVGTGDMKMQGLASAIGTGVLPTFKNAGLGMTDFGAAISTLTDNSTPAEVAANHLKTSIMLLQNQSGPAGKALHEMGIEQGQLASDISKPGGLMIAVRDLKMHMEQFAGSGNVVKLSASQISSEVNKMGLELTKEGVATGEQKDMLDAYKHSLETMGSAGQQAAALLAKSFGGARSAMTMETLVEQSDRLDSKYKQMGTTATRAAQAQEDWAHTQETFKQRQAEATAGLQAMAIAVGEKLMPVVSTVMGLFSQFADFISKNQTAATVLAVVIGGALVIAFSALLTVFWGLAANPVTLIIAAIIAVVSLLAFGVYELITHWNDVMDWFSRLWETIKGIFFQAIRAVVGFVQDWYPLILGILTGGILLLPALIFKYWDQIVDFFASLPGKAADGLSSLGSLIGGIASDAWHSFTGFISRGVDAVIDYFVHLPQRAGYALGFLAGTLARAGADAITSLVDSIKRGAEIAFQWFKDLPANIATLVSNAYEWLKGPASDMINGFMNSITQKIVDVYAWFDSLPKKILDILSDAGHWLLDTGSNIVDGLWQGLKSAYHAVDDWLRALPSRVMNFFSDAGRWLIDTGSNILHGLWQGISDGASWLWNQITGFANNIIQGFKDAFGIHSPSTVFAELGGHLMDGLSNGIVDKTTAAVGAAQRAASQVIAGVSGQFALNGAVNLQASSSGAFSSGLGAGVGGGTVINLNVAGSLIQESNVRRMIQDIVLQHAGRNVGNGLGQGTAVRF